MRLEEKDLSFDETILYLSKPLPLIGTFYQNEHSILQNLLFSGLVKTALLTADFLYLKSVKPENLSDAKMLAIAELDDYTTFTNEQEAAPLHNLVTKIELILKLIIAPLLQKDGGNIKLETYADGIIYVHFLGKCQGCPYAKHTLKNHVEKNLLRYLPQTKEVVLV